MARKKVYKGEQNAPCDTMVCLTQQLEKWFLLKSLSPPNQNSFPIEAKLLITHGQRNPPSHPWIKFFLWCVSSMAVFGQQAKKEPDTELEDRIPFGWSLTPFSSADPLLPHPLLLGNHKSVLYVCESVSILQIRSFVSYFRKSDF